MASGSPDYYTPDAQLADSLDSFDSFITGLADVVTELELSVTKLIEIVEAVAARRRTDYAVITTTKKKIIDGFGFETYYVTFYSHPDNTASINLYISENGAEELIKVLAVGELFGMRSAKDIMSAQSVSGTQYLKFTLGGT